MEGTTDGPAGYAAPALDAGDGLTPLCLACLGPVDLGHHLELAGRGLYVDVATPEGVLRSVLCRGCSAGDAEGRLAALGVRELARRLTGGGGETRTFRK